jgi:hypothetical protein
MLKQMTAITVEPVPAGRFAAIGSQGTAGCRQSPDASCNTCGSACISDYEFEVDAHPAEEGSSHVEDRLVSDVDVLGI